MLHNHHVFKILIIEHTISIDSKTKLIVLITLTILITTGIKICILKVLLNLFICKAYANFIFVYNIFLKNNQKQLFPVT